MYGWMGKILRIDLTDKQTTEEKIATNVLREFIGGRGLGAKLLLEDLKPGIDPLGPENEIIFSAGPLGGVPVAGATRCAILGKSPLTGIYGETNCSGSFGPEIKRCGYDAIVVQGASETPVYVLVQDNEVKIKNAKHIWGKTTGEAHSSLLKDIGSEKAHTACIGPAGENLVKYASVICDLFHAGGRVGLGAVMGSKMLKALGLYGSNEIEVADNERFKQLNKEIAKEVYAKGEAHRKYGTAETIAIFNETGRLPTKGYRKGVFDGAHKISGETMADTILIRRDACLACPIACNRIVKADEQYEVDPAYGGPEYETLAALGSFCCNDNLVAICKANELCNKYGLDTMSTGVSIAFAMECFEKGLLTCSDAGGIDLTWGNHETIIELIHQIVQKKGLGKLLCEGVRVASSKIKGSEDFALHIKGLEMPFHDPRVKVGMGLSFATSNRGACHLQSFSDSVFENKNGLIKELGMNEPVSRTETNELKSKYVAISQDLNALYDSLVVCKWTIFPFGYSLNTLTSLVTAVTGCNFTLRELAVVGERAFNLGRIFNSREGIARKDDTIPIRFAEPLEPPNPNKGIFPQYVLDKMLDYYYEARGWDIETGLPKPGKLIELGLKDFVYS